MVILGIGLGIAHAGLLRLFQVFIEFRDITERSNEAPAHVLRRVLELVWWCFEEAVFLLVLGVILTILGVWHQKRNNSL